MRELSSLIGLQVISTSEGKKLGSVAEVYVDLAAGELVCVTLAKTPELRVILADDIDVIGDDALMVSDRGKVRSREDAEEQLERGKRVLDNPPLVITSQGKTLGRLGTVQIDEATRKVVRFEVTGGSFKDLTEGVLALPVLEGIVHGDDTVIVPHDVVARRLVQAGGLRGALRHLGERLKISAEDLSETSRDRSAKLKERAEELAKKAGEATEKAKERLSEVAEEAKERVSEVAEEAKERVAEVVEDAKHAREAEEGQEAGEEPDAEPQSPQAEDAADEEGIDEDDASRCEETEVHLAPEVATPLPEGEAATDEDDAEDADDDETEQAKHDDTE